MLIFMRAILLRKTGNHSGLTLVGNLNKPSKYIQGDFQVWRYFPQRDYLKKHFKSRNPVFNIPRRNEPVATDTFFSDTPAMNDGSTMAQFFVGTDTLVCDTYGIKSQKHFINTLYDNIKTTGAMDTIITDVGSIRFPRKLLTFSGASSSNNMNQNPITSIKTKLNSAMVLSSFTSMP